jgi:phosphoribosylanthranilate isomerase
VVRVKICGITNLSDARDAVDAGADAVGFVFAASPRKVTAETAKKISRWVQPAAAAVGVFVDESTERMLRVGDLCALNAIQLHGNEGLRVVRRLQRHGFQVLKAVRAGDGESLKRAQDSGADALLFDTASAGRFGGTGKTFDWEFLKEQKFDLPWFVSGGLNAKNVKDLLATVRPYGVDVSSGVEKAPGKKSIKQVKEFIHNAKSAR